MDFTVGGAAKTVFTATNPSYFSDVLVLPVGFFLRLDGLKSPHEASRWWCLLLIQTVSAWLSSLSHLRSIKLYVIATFL